MLRSRYLADLAKFLKIEQQALPTVVKGVTHVMGMIKPGYIFVHADERQWPATPRRSCKQIDLAIEEALQVAAERGAIAAIVSQEVNASPLPVLRVDDTRRALWALGAEIREQANSSTVAVTGTAGKTTVMRMAEFLLTEHTSVVSTHQSINTIDGVATAAAQLIQNPEVGVFEVAISGLGRFTDCSSAEILKPNIAVITSTGIAHRDVADTIFKTAEIKGKILETISDGGVAIINGDMHYADYLKQKALDHGAGRVVTVGRSQAADYRLVEWRPSKHSADITAEINGHLITYRLGNPNGGVALSSLMALAIATELGQPIDDSLTRVKDYPFGKRLAEVRTLRTEEGDITIIDDSKNAADVSYQAAVDLVVALAKSYEGRALVAAGHIVFLGSEASKVHGRLGTYIRHAGVNELFTYGEDMNLMRDEAKTLISTPHAQTPEEFAQMIAAHAKPGDVILIKGSHRGTGLREVAPLLRRALRQIYPKPAQQDGQVGQSVKPSGASGVIQRIRGLIRG